MSNLKNRRSEANDSLRVTIYMTRKGYLGKSQYSSLANQVKRQIDEVLADKNMDLETYFVY